MKPEHDFPSLRLTFVSMYLPPGLLSCQPGPLISLTCLGSWCLLFPAFTLIMASLGSSAHKNTFASQRRPDIRKCPWPSPSIRRMAEPWSMYWITGKMHILITQSGEYLPRHILALCKDTGRQECQQSAIRREVLKRTREPSGGHSTRPEMDLTTNSLACATGPYYERPRGFVVLTHQVL